MSDNKNEHVVVAFYPTIDAAESAAEALQFMDKASDAYEFGAVGTLVATPDGKIKTNVGHKAGKGAKVGAIAGIIAGIFTGGATVIGGLIVGSVVGSSMGAFLKKSTHLTEDELNKIADELKAGKAAVVVTCDEHELQPILDELTLIGGTVWTYEVSAEAMEAAALADETPADEAMNQAAAVAGPAAGILGVAGAEAAVQEQL